MNFSTTSYDTICEVNKNAGRLRFHHLPTSGEIPGSEANVKSSYPKTFGSDSICNKVFSPASLAHLSNLVNKFFNTGNFRICRKNSGNNLLFKGGNRLDPICHRPNSMPVSLSTTPENTTFSRVNLFQWRFKVLHRTQLGFRLARSAADTIASCTFFPDLGRGFEYYYPQSLLKKWF